MSALKKATSSLNPSNPPPNLPLGPSIHLPGPSIQDLLSAESLGFFSSTFAAVTSDSTRLSATRRFGAYPAVRSGLCAARHPSWREREGW